MSTYWDLWCRTCNAKSDAFHWNHGESQIRELIPHLPAIVAFDTEMHGTALEINAWCSAERFSFKDLVVFGREHAGHDIRPRNQYGDYDDECGHRFDCSHCGSWTRCKRKHDHGGPHAA